MGNKKLSDFIRNNISDSDLEENKAKHPSYASEESDFVKEEAKYPIEPHIIEKELKYPLKVPDWYYRVVKLSYEWHGILNDNYKDYVFLSNVRDIRGNIQDQASTRSFSLSYRFNANHQLRPRRPVYENVSKDFVDEAISASIENIRSYYLIEEDKSSKEKYENDAYMLAWSTKSSREDWESYDKGRWINIF